MTDRSFAGVALAIAVVVFAVLIYMPRGVEPAQEREPSAAISAVPPPRESATAYPDPAVPRWPSGTRSRPPAAASGTDAGDSASYSSRRVAPVTAPSASERSAAARPRQPEAAPAGLASLRIVVVDTQHIPVSSAWVTLNSDARSDRGITSIQGEVLFDGLAADSYSYILEAPGRPALASGKPVTLGAEESKTITLWLGTDDLSISGRVLDDDGEPIAEAAVVARRRSGTVVGELVSMGWPGEAETFTDPDGRYEITGLQAGTYHLRTVASERFPMVAILAEAGDENADLIVPATRAFSIYGTVKDSIGRRLSGVRIVAAGQPEGRTTSDANGRYAIEVKRAPADRNPTLQFSAPGYRGVTLAAGTADTTRDRSIRLDAELTPLPYSDVRVSGTLTADGKPVSAARVQLYSPTAGRAFRTTSGENGAFSLDVAAAEDYRLAVYTGGRYRDYVRSQVALTALSEYLDVSLEPLEDARLRGTVVDAEGASLADVRLQVSSDLARGLVRQVLTDSFGRFGMEQAPEGKLTFNSSGGQVSGFVLSRGESAEIELVLDLGDQVLEGWIVDERGRGLAGASVQMAWSRQGGGLQSRASRTTMTDAEGFFRFGRLGPGTHELAVRAPGYKPKRLTIEPESGIEIPLAPSEP